MIRYITSLTTVSGPYTPPATSTAIFDPTTWTLCLEFTFSSTTIAYARFAFQDNNSLSGPTAVITGGVSSPATVRFTWKPGGFPRSRDWVGGLDVDDGLY